MMAAPVGNRFWEQRSSHGRKPIFESPGKLWEAACEYFEWVEDNPLSEMKAFSYQGEIIKTDIPKMRAMTESGLCLFLDIGVSTLHDYKKNKDFSEVISRIEKVIFTQKFEGAAADMLNANIISRELGLSDKTQIEQSGGLTHSHNVALPENLAELDATELAKLYFNKS